MNAQLVADLERLLEIKKELLASMLEAMKRSAAALNGDDMDAFNSEMEACTKTMAMVDEMGVAETSLRAEIPDVKKHPQIIRLESGITYMLEQIEHVRKECNDIAQQQLLNYGQQIKSVRRTQKGIDGYASQYQHTDAIFFDAKK